MTDTLSVGGVIHGASELNLPSVSNTETFTHSTTNTVHIMYMHMHSYLLYVYDYMAIRVCM